MLYANEVINLRKDPLLQIPASEFSETQDEFGRELVEQIRRGVFQVEIRSITIADTQTDPQ